jgi:Putative addiction module component
MCYAPDKECKKMSSEVTQEYLNEEEWWIEEGYASPEDVPVPDWHLAILEERRARYEREPVEWIPWEEIRDELMQKVIEEIKRRKK